MEVHISVWIILLLLTSVLARKTVFNQPKHGLREPSKNSSTVEDNSQQDRISGYTNEFGTESLLSSRTTRRAKSDISNAHLPLIYFLSKRFQSQTTPNRISQSKKVTNLNFVEAASQNVSVEDAKTTPNLTSEGNSNFRIVCYFSNWAWYRPGRGKYLPSDINPSLCTHIMYAFATLDASTLTIKSFDTWADLDNKFYQKVLAYKAKGIKVMISLGGWTDSAGNKYSKLVNSPSARANFIKNVVNFIQHWGFQGLDIDWEYPKCWQGNCNRGPASDKQGFAAWVEELHRALKPKGLLLSAAVSPSKKIIDAGYDVQKLAKNFDFINVMTYDYHGSWDGKTGHVSPLHHYPGDTYPDFNSDFSMHYWIKRGMHPKKLQMGVPFYGKTFTLSNPSNHGLNAPSRGPGQAGEFTRAAGTLAYYEICDRIKHHGWNVVGDPQGRIGPYAYKNNQWVSYDDTTEIRKKAQFIRRLGLGGVIIWALDLDDFKNSCGFGSYPLLSALRRELRATSTEE